MLCTSPPLFLFSAWKICSREKFSEVSHLLVHKFRLSHNTSNDHLVHLMVPKGVNLFIGNVFLAAWLRFV